MLVEVERQVRDVEIGIVLITKGLEFLIVRYLYCVKLEMLRSPRRLTRAHLAS
jgi:hypothetical protein